MCQQLAGEGTPRAEVRGWEEGVREGEGGKGASVSKLLPRAPGALRLRGPSKERDLMGGGTCALRQQAERRWHVHDTGADGVHGPDPHETGALGDVLRSIPRAWERQGASSD